LNHSVFVQHGSNAGRHPAEPHIKKIVKIDLFVF